MSTVCCIPARIGSSRIKQKMLINYKGKPLVKYMYDKVSSFGYRTYVVTDSERIAELIPKENVIVSGDASNGTDRISSVVDRISADKIINVQGDLVDVTKELILKIEQELDWEQVVTAYTKNEQSVRVVHNYGYANWFTRKDLGYGDYHIGIYGYKRNPLVWYYVAGRTDAEQIEDLEQLRFLGYYNIGVVEYDYTGIEINEQKDLQNV